MSHPITVIGILGMEHSGTTLLSRMLGAHSAAFSIGGLKNMAAFARGQKACSCGGNAQTCEVWSAVASALAVQGLELQALAGDLMIRSGSESREAAQTLLHAVASATGRPLLIESSRDPRCLAMLADSADITVVPVHIFKPPRAQVASAKRKGRSVVKELRKYASRSHRCRMAIRQYAGGMAIPYDSLCEQPDYWIQQIMARTPHAAEPAQTKAWGAVGTHMIGGNRMRFNTDSTIHPDDRWKSNLSTYERLLADLLGWLPFVSNRRDVPYAGE